MAKYLLFLKYVAKHPSKPSFHPIRLDNEELITNIFWVDVKMIINYAHFGNDFGFDTTFGTNKEFRPLAMFIGFNHQ